MVRALKSWFAKAPKLQVRHPELGVLVRSGGIWFGAVQRGDRKVHFTVAGTDTAPDAGLLVRLFSMLARFDEIERMGAESLRRQEPIGRAEMELHAVDFLWSDRPDDFVLVFSANGDDSRQGSVSFEAGQPQDARSFDD